MPQRLRALAIGRFGPMLVVLCVLGCSGPRPTPGTVGPGMEAVRPELIETDPALLPSYAELVERYNARIAGLERLWSRAKLRLAWVEDDQQRFEVVDGVVVFVAPGRLALQFEKPLVGEIWAGTNEVYYWFINLIDDRYAVFGRHDQAHRHRWDVPWLQVRPQDMLRVLGVARLDPEADAAVESFNGYYLIEPPGTRSRVLIEPVTFRPVRIDLVDAQGYTRVAALLEGAVRVEQADGARADWPLIPRRVRVQAIDKSIDMDLTLRDATDARGGRRRISDKLFDLQAMLKLNKVPEDQRYDLDQR